MFDELSTGIEGDEAGAVIGLGFSGFSGRINDQGRDEDQRRDPQQGQSDDRGSQGQRRWEDHDRRREEDNSRSFHRLEEFRLQEERRRGGVGRHQDIRRGNYGAPRRGSRPANRQPLGPLSEDDIRLFQAVRQFMTVWTENGDRFHSVPVHLVTDKLFDDDLSIKYHRWQRQQK